MMNKELKEYHIDGVDFVDDYSYLKKGLEIKSSDDETTVVLRAILKEIREVNKSIDILINDGGR